VAGRTVKIPHGRYLPGNGDFGVAHRGRIGAVNAGGKRSDGWRVRTMEATQPAAMSGRRQRLNHRMKKTTSTEEVSLHPGENGLASQKNIETARCQRKSQDGLKKKLANVWSRQRIKQTPARAVGKKPYGKPKRKSYFQN
jgi:hypothetical protein